MLKKFNRLFCIYLIQDFSGDFIDGGFDAGIDPIVSSEFYVGGGFCDPFYPIYDPFFPMFFPAPLFFGAPPPVIVHSAHPLVSQQPLAHVDKNQIQTGMSLPQSNIPIYNNTHLHSTPLSPHHICSSVLSQKKRRRRRFCGCVSYL